MARIQNALAKLYTRLYRLSNWTISKCATTWRLVKSRAYSFVSTLTEDTDSERGYLSSFIS